MITTFLCLKSKGETGRTEPTLVHICPEANSHVDVSISILFDPIKSGESQKPASDQLVVATTLIGSYIQRITNQRSFRGLGKIANGLNVRYIFFRPLAELQPYQCHDTVLSENFHWSCPDTPLVSLSLPAYMI